MRLSNYTCVLLLVILSACSPYPRYTYYELDEAIATAPTEEEKEFHRARQAEMEKTIEKAYGFIEAVQWCDAQSKCVVVCQYNGPSPRYGVDLEKTDLSDIEKTLRWYRLVKPPTCGFDTGEW